jgi:phage baseplate assembly protein W
MNTHTHTQARSRHWQLAPDSTGIIQDAADIEQCIFNILGTRKGTDVCRPAFGSNHFDYIDTPEDVFVPNCVREVILAIKTWEPRAEVTQVTFAGNAPHIMLTVHWRVAAAVAGEIYRSDILLKAA